MERQPVRLIVNPAAGDGRALRVLSRVEKTLSQEGISYEVAVTNSPGHATTLAKETADLGWPLVTAVGGDGTINEVIQGLAHTQTALSIIPGGTGNDLARSLAIPFEAELAARLLLSGATSRIDLGIETDRTFSSLASIGFPVDVIRHVNETSGILKGSLKIFSGVWKTIQKLQTYPITLTCDGRHREIRAVGLFILNTRYTGGGLMMAPDANPADGLLDVAIVHELSRWELLATLPKVYKGTHINHPAIEFVRCRCIEVYSPRPLPKMFDGDLVGMTPLNASISTAALKIVVPAQTAAALGQTRSRLGA